MALKIEVDHGTRFIARAEQGRQRRRDEMALFPQAGKRQGIGSLVKVPVLFKL
ncbi:hypothetical protein ISP15_08485 [Dyella jejuensis]|uniref:Uncharacterized protein n=1 Tax=Dyella jejuensis TaxID=1432009 RepID=A0ABW8JJB0_9GAMM